MYYDFSTNEENTRKQQQLQKNEKVVVLLQHTENPNAI